MNHAIEVKNLNKNYDEFSLKNINFTVPSGTVVGLIGQNGAGKSTLISAMLGLIDSQYEMNKLLGKDIKQNEKDIKEDIAVIFDQTHYNQEFTPLFIGKILSKIYKTWDQNKFIDYLDKFNIPKSKKIKKFSKGMKMKMEFALAFSHDTKLLILDEATSGLDPIFRNEVLDILREYTEDENHSILISSHITSDLDKIADYIAFIDNGEILFTKPYDEIRDEYGMLTCKEETFKTLNEEDIIAYQKETYGYKVLLKNKHEIRKIFTDLVIENASIEDVMLYYIKGDKLA